MPRKSKRYFVKRINFLVFLTYLITVLVCGRLFVLAVVKHDFYFAQADIQKQYDKERYIKRGEIYLKTVEGVHHALALNKSFPMIYAEPNLLEHKNLLKIARKLSDVLKIDKDTILIKLSDQDDPFEIIKHEASEQEVNEIKKLNIQGISTQEEENLRYYPNQELASHVVGFLGHKGDKKVGQYGVEEYYDDLLSGKKELYEKPQLNIIPEDTCQGEDIFLSMDPNIQLFIEEGLQKAVEKYNAAGGTVIVMNPKNGYIMGMANYPDFNPNKYQETPDLKIFINRAISAVFEPGSVFKPIIVAAALNEGKITPKSTYEDYGEVKIGGYTIYNADHKVYGEQTMMQVLEKSINTGVIYIQRQLEQSVLKKYIKNFGFGKKTNIDLPGEVSGSLANLESGREINFATASFGQGISVTPIQLIQAISTIANKGLLMQPKIVEYHEEDGNITGTHQGQETSSRRVISRDTANRLTAMLVNVTENGTASKAKLNDYWVAAKTGTAQIPSTKKKGYGEDSIHTMIGFAPAYNAEFAILVKLDKPQGVRFSALSVAPLFKDITEYLLNYLEIPPQK
jgi:stage V sporulation protein D (sporulation-specific penicillin-binding protein)